MNVAAVCVLQVSLYEDDASHDKLHGAQQTDDDCTANVPVCLQVSSAANHTPWVIQRSLARSVLDYIHCSCWSSWIVQIAVGPLLNYCILICLSASLHCYLLYRVSIHLQNPEKSGNLTLIRKKSGCATAVDSHKINITWVLLSKVDMHKMDCK